MFENDNCIGLGVVRQNTDGLDMASLSQLVPLPPIVIEVETLVATPALELALELGFDNIVLEGDSKSCRVVAVPWLNMDALSMISTSLHHIFQLLIYLVYVGIVMRLLIHT